MATAKPNNGQLPTGFVSPFNRVEMKGTHDDLLACAATLCGKSIDDAKKVAVALGMPNNGPFCVDDELFRKVVFNLSQLIVGDYQDFTAVAALPDVAVLCLVHDKYGETYRHIVFHHVRATDTTPSFSYVIDPANWLDPKLHVTGNFDHLDLKPAWYMEIKQRPGGTATRSK